MPRQKDRRSSKSRLSVWTTVFFHSVIILHMTQINAGESLTNSQPRIMAVIGQTQDITLLCSVDPPMNAVDEMVEWSRSDLNPRFVHVWRSGEDHLIGQNPSYKNRTSVSIEKLKTGDASLKLTKVRLSDEGTYRCFIPGLSADLSVELVVEADIQIIKVSPGVLECKSKGWYPEPDVFWLESEGKIIPAGSKEMFRGPDDLYALSSRLTLEKGHSKNITCRIQQNKQHREVKIHVPDDFSVDSARSTIAALIVGIIFITFIVFLVFLVWKWRKNNMETGSKEKMQDFGKDQEEESLMREEKVNDSSHVSLCQIEVENDHVSNKNIMQTTKTGTQQNNNHPGREITNNVCKSHDGRQAQPEQFDNNSERRNYEIPNLTDNSGQGHRPKQHKDANTEENKTQTINERADQSPIKAEGKKTTDSEGEDTMKQKQDNIKENVSPTRSERNMAKNQNQVGGDVDGEKRAKEVSSANRAEIPPMQHDSKENQSEKPITTQIVMSGGQKQEIKEAGGEISQPQAENVDGNGNNETAALSGKTIGQHNSAEEGHTYEGGQPLKGMQGEDPQVKRLQGEDPQTKGLQGQDTQTKGLEGQDPQTKGLQGQDTQTMGLEGEDQQTKGLQGQDTQTKGLEGQDTQTKGLQGEDPQTKGSEGQDTQTKGLEGQDTQKKELQGED
uniref:Ig-like domain-containing protein n=1 Tax=Maylandia zebra TaxID=106582 RepID=A0A3P9DRV3_9CICH